MYRFLLIVIISWAFPTLAQELEFLPGDWQNPAVFEKGQNLPHAFHIPYSTSESAIQNLPRKCENYQLLNDKWKFKWFETPVQVQEEFWQPDFKVEDWDEIKVPSNWQMEGYGHPKFRNIAISFENDPPNIPDYYNPTGCYKRKFSVPVNWEEKEIMLRFEGIKSAAYVWVNGKRVGYNQGGFEPAEFNISSFVEQGENDLAVQVLRFSDGSYLENQDMWRLSGIFRDVKLYAQPKTFIHDHYVISNLDDRYEDANLQLELKIQNRLETPTSGSVAFNVFNKEGRSILAEGWVLQDFEVDSFALKTVQLTTEVVDPPKWSAEFPNLFTLLVQLKDETGKITEAFTQKIGFRELEYKDNVFLVNGVAVKLNGVNSHMHHPEHGQAVPVETLKQDLLLLKQHNINCVRTSHYPPSPEYLELADELGIYIIDEVGDEAHQNIHLSTKSEWTEMYRDRARKLVYRDRNHPSVIMWSAGNESGSGFNIDEVIKTGKEIDPSRPAWMYGGNTFYIPFEDIVGPRYWLPINYKLLAEGKILPSNDSRASFMDEYLAATGNGLGGMDEYWEYIWKHPRLMGGAIWDWVSPGIKTPLHILPDLSGAKNDAQIMGRPVFAEGKNGWGLEFTGHDDWLEFYRDSTLDITGKNLSLGFWIKPMEIDQANVFLAKGKHGYGIQMADKSTLEFYVFAGKRFSAKTKVNAGFYNTWHHIAGIYNGSTLQLFIDGKRVASTACNVPIQHTPFPLCIGREAESQDQGEYSGRMSKMVIDEVKVYDKTIGIGEFENPSPEDAILFLNFEKDTVLGDFYAVGLGGRTYGIVFPDRTVQPEIHQIKRSGQPIKIEEVDAENGVFQVTNRHHFKNLNELEGVWQLFVDGEPGQRGFFTCDIAAGETAEVSIDYRRPRIESSTECILEISFVLRDELNWAEKGHEVAWEQFKVPTELYFITPEEPLNTLTSSENEEELLITGANFEYCFSKQSGLLKSLYYKEKEYLKKALNFNVWRAPLANDIDPWGNYMFGKENRTAGYGRSIDNQLRTLGMRHLISEVESISATQVNDKEVRVEIRAFSFSSNSLPQKNNGNISAFERKENWQIFADGKIILEQEIIPHGKMPDMLQKVGWQLELPKSFDKVEYYGRGPFENYPDRKTGAKIGRYTSTIDSMYVPYLLPQDYGNRSDVRWMKIQDEAGRGLRFESEDLLNFSLHKYSTENLSRAIYSYQLKDAANAILNVDSDVSGVGGTAIRQLQKYRVLPGVKKNKLVIKPF